jgi:hypothetical protein
LKTGNDHEKKKTDEAARNLEDLLRQANSGEVRASRKVHLLRRLRTLMKDYGNISFPSMFKRGRELMKLNRKSCVAKKPDPGVGPT